MKYRVENVLATVKGLAEGKAQAQELERRDRTQQAALTLRGMALAQSATQHQGASRQRMVAELGRTVRSPGFNPESPLGRAVHARLASLVAEDAGQDGGRPTPAAGGFIVDRRREGQFGQLGVQAAALLRQAERVDTGTAKRLGALGLKLKARPDGFTPELGAAALDSARDDLARLRRAKEVGAEVKTAAEWLETNGQRRVIKPSFQQEYSALRQGLPKKAPTTAEEVRQAEAYVERVRVLRGKDPFGPTLAAQGARERVEELRRMGHFRNDDRYRDNVRQARSPGELLASLEAQRAHAKKAGLPVIGQDEPDLEDAPRQVVMRKIIARPGDFGKPGGSVRMGPATAPQYREETVTEPGSLTKARRLRAAAQLARPQLREATLRESLNSYALLLRSPIFGTLAPESRREVLEGLNEVRATLGLPGLPETLNDRLTPQERQEYGIRDAREDLGQVAAGLSLTRKRLTLALRVGGGEQPLTGAQYVQLRALTGQLTRLEKMVGMLRASPRPDWAQIDALIGAYRTLTRNMKELIEAPAEKPPTKAPPPGPVRKATLPASGKPGVPILPPVSPGRNP